MMKAHIDVLGEVNGVELDYLFTNIKDCVALIKLDFPFQDWTDMYIDVASQIKTEMMNLRVGAGINNLKLGGSFLKLKRKIITDLTFNNNFLNMVYEDDSNKLIRIRGKTFLFDTSMNMKNINHGEKNLLSELQVEVNGQNKIHLYKNSPMKVTSMMIQDIFLPLHVNSTVTFDQFKELKNTSMQTVQIGSQFSWDTSQFHDNSFMFNFGIRKSEHCGDFSTVARLPGRIPITTRAIVSSSSTTSSNSVELFLGSENESDYERIMFQHTFIQLSETNLEKRHIIKFKTYVFEFDTHSSESLLTSSDSINLKWGSTGKSLKGLGYLLNNEEREGFSETRLILSHPLDSKDDNILAMILQKKDGKTMFDIKVDHPNKSKQFSLKVWSKKIYICNI
jgi:hypothetical protein